MGQASTIRDFLVALGFKTDNAGLSQMQGAMKGVELNAKALNAALGALATAAVVAVRQTASELDKLYFSSQRIGASAGNINAFGNAISQMGGSAEGAVNTLETLAEKMRNSPGYEGMLNSLGVGTKDANGNARDRVEIMKDLSGVLSKMPAYQANAYASSLGIDQNTLLAMRDGKFISNMEKYQKLQKEMGMNDDLTKSGNEFMSEYRDLTMITKTGLQVIVMQAGKALIPVLRLLNQMLQAGIHAFSQLNPHIKEGLAIGLRFGMLALVFGTFFKTFGLLFKFMPMLKSFIGLLKLMRLAFLASPIGIILALAAALYLLYDDYKTWKEGGRSLFDWSKWTNGIEKIIGKIKDFLAILEKVKDKVIQFIHKVVDDPVEAVKDVAQAARGEVEKLAEKAPDSAKKAIQKTQEVVKQSAAVAVGAGRAVVHSVRQLASTAGGKYGFSFGKDVDGYIREASIKFGIDEKVLRGFIHMEGGWKGATSSTGAIGVGQFIKSTWNGLAATDEGKAIGMTKITKGNFRKSNDPRYNKRINTLATALLAKKNAELLQKHGISATGENLYLMHNMGGSLIPAMKGDNSINDTLRKNIDVNVEKKRRGMSPVNFVKYQKGRFNKNYKIANKPASTARVSLPSNSQGLANFAQNAEVPTGNPHRSQINSSRSSSSNVTIHQEYNTTMTINGAREPVESANAVKRNQDNANAIMARSAQNIMV
ncbi:phage tail tape measure protein [Acinetobacter baumannii]